MITMRDCDTCAYESVAGNQEPCASCHGDTNNWADEDARIDQIGQNGNDGLHYPPSKADQIRLFPTRIIAVDVVDDVLFTLEAFDEIAATIEIKTVLSKANIKPITEAIIAGLDLMGLEG